MHRPEVLPGTPARSVTPLRPSGKVSIGGSTFDARASGQWIDAHQPVSVHRVDGFGLVVGPQGTTPLGPDAGPPGTPNEAPEATHRPLNRQERHLSGLIAFGALGTGAGGIGLLVLAFRVRPMTLLVLLGPVLVGGAISGAALYGLISMALDLGHRLARRDGVLGWLVRSTLEILLVVALLAIVATGLVLVLGAAPGGDDGPR
jgi:hypothetical protein